MGLLDLAFPGNPFSGWLDQNRNKVTGAFGGLAGAGNDPRGALQGFVGGLQGGVAPDNAFVQQQQLQAEKTAAVKAEQDKQAAQIAWLRQNGQNQYADMLEAGFMAPTDVGKQLTAQSQPAADPADVATYKFYANQELLAGRKPKSFDDWRTGSNQTVRGSLGSTLPYMDAQGGFHPIVQMSDGTLRDPITGQPPDPSWKYSPTELAAAKANTVGDAKTAVTARAALPGAEQAYAITNKALDRLIGPTPDPNAVAGQAEQFGGFMGIPTGQIIPALWNTHKADFRNLVSQLSGDAFLQIRQALKGAGQVTDFEGMKGELALTRLKAASENGTAEDFQNALNDFREAIDNGMRLLREQAQGGYSAGQPAVTGGGTTTYTFNPATGQLE